MSKLTFRPAARAFLDPDRIDADRPEDARACIIPFGLEASVTYGGGTGKGPEAIIEASHALEHFDDELWCEPYAEFGIATLDTAPKGGSLKNSVFELAEYVELVLAANKFPLTIGGEHALTPGALRPFAARYDDLVVVQFDAHADLRDGYQGEKFSHAAAMRRVLDYENISIISFGIRSICKEDADTMEAFGPRISTYWAREKADWSLEKLSQLIDGRPVYISFDVDGLDPSIMPATGTPEPGGLLWDETLEILRAVSNAGRIVGADVVELAPIAGYRAADFTAARLVYKILSYALSSQQPTT